MFYFFRFLFDDLDRLVDKYVYSKELDDIADNNNRYISRTFYLLFCNLSSTIGDNLDILEDKTVKEEMNP